MITDIWTSKTPYVIAEVSQNHDGSLGQAHAFIDAVASTGANAIKFQTHIAEEESTILEPFRVKFSYEDATRYDYWKRMEFTEEQWAGLYEHACNKGLDFLSSPFSIKALSMLERIGVPAWKFGAGEIFNEKLFDEALKTGKPILISTGLSTFQDIDKVVTKVKDRDNQYMLFQCVTAYPSTADMIDISLINQFKERYNCPIGISDHSSTIYPSLAAFSLGAIASEVHVAMSPYMFGPDVKASVSLEDLKRIVEGAKFIATMRNTKVDFSKRDESRENLKQMFTKSLFAADYIKSGTVITEDMLVAKKPNIGIDSSKVNSIVGMKATKDIEKNELITLNMLVK